MERSCWLILGASSPIARAFAQQAASRGSSLLLAGRDLEDLEQTSADLRIRFGVPVSCLYFDALEFATHDPLVERCRSEEQLNILLAFGSMPEQQAMQNDIPLAMTCLNANLNGAVAILERLAVQLEAQRSGRLVVIGSVAGDRGRLKNYIYGAAKAGLHAYVQGLRARLFRSGVTVTTIKPGFVDTSMTWGMPGLFLVASPETCGATIWHHAEKGTDLRYVPWFWWGIMTIIKVLPEKMFKRLSI